MLTCHLLLTAPRRAVRVAALSCSFYLSRQTPPLGAAMHSWTTASCSTKSALVSCCLIGFGLLLWLEFVLWCRCLVDVAQDAIAATMGMVGAARQFAGRLSPSPTRRHAKQAHVTDLHRSNI